ncbi:right-handed parallel beta-helix repeat-containing protein [Ornithinimicrobium cerasi]|uniref:Right handed beta helix region n=1 Tax=Ornithinimicrobium cerasi TaxID=2248773 RepID=A0A285VHJ6_9MICO|nr:right-handed parallel beta-helix repeat-containing protein [Ornithinimicrobium cerasi]SOC52011.1 Right handed beta helix region [Ornithinimicrobium cerasi]
MNRTSRLGAAGAATLLLPVLGYAVPAAAADLACGDVVMTSTVLTSDLVCGPGDGLVIGADGVVLDLGGHHIMGAGAYGAGAGAGVRIANRSGVTVTNGHIGHFASALEIQQSWGATVTGIHAGHGDRGINVGTGGGHVIHLNVLHDNGRDAVRVDGSVDVEVSKNDLDGNVFGIGLYRAVDAEVVKNTVDGSVQWAIAVDASSVGTDLVKNVVSGTVLDGILVTSDTTGTVLTKNEVYASGWDGIDVRSASATLTKNLAVGNGLQGIAAVDGVTDGGGNMAAGNGDARQCTGVVCTAPR